METTTTYQVSISTPRRKDFDAIIKAIKGAGANDANVKYDGTVKAWIIEVDTANAHPSNVERHGLPLAAICAAGAPDLIFYANDITIEQVQQ